MKFFGSGRTRLTAMLAAVLVAGGVGMAFAANSGSSMSMTPSNAMHHGRGINEFGMTKAFYKGHSTSFTYSHGYWCDKSVKSTASSRCEAGAQWKKAPSKQHDPLYITVPLGFDVKPMSMDCPTGLVCVDHPGTIDLRRLEPALKPLYPDLTKKQLLKVLANSATPGHQHFITTKFGGKPEWWDVRVVGVTSKAEYQKISNHKSAHYLLKQVKAGKTTGVIPTNLFLYFGVK
ncbi:MAG: hypothetical protein QM747_15150 [Nocardioides sp.]